MKDHDDYITEALTERGLQMPNYQVDNKGHYIYAPGWPKGIVQVVRELRSAYQIDLVDALIMVGKIFGVTVNRQHTSWDPLRAVLHDNNISFEHIKGPHTMTLLKALAAKHELNVSDQ